MKSLYAQVILNIVHDKIDRPFTYKIPSYLQDSIKEGCCVIIPFGKGNQEKKGYVIGITDRCEYAEHKLKSILDIANMQMSLEGKMIDLAFWMKQQYGSTLIQALKTVLPITQKSNQKISKSIVSLVTKEELKAIEQECLQKNRTAQAKVIRALIEGERINQTEFVKQNQISTSSLRSLELKKIVKIEETRQFRNLYPKERDIYAAKILSEEQAKIVDAIGQDIEEEVGTQCYIHGITGSGKTQVYIELIQKVIEKGKQAIVLIPEISLTHQTLQRFYECFGERVSILNSSLTAGEKYDQCERAQNGEIDIIIGPRSALFTPFHNLGLIIVDEEHEPSYKSEYAPKYHAREVAEQIAKMENAILVLGSATPSIEAYYKAMKGEYQLFEMSKRIGTATLPKVDVIDMRVELKKGNRSILCTALQESIQERLTRKEQIILFLNRRGYVGFISCRSCGYVLKCPHCDISLTEHKDKKMHCHYCGYTQERITQCPECTSKYVSGFKAGTQAIEDVLKDTFKNARILRMDADTTRTKGSYEKILKSFANHEADILLGTQMIVKGHDFKAVTLVGILAADLSLGMPDYRSGERTFQLLTQAAGRAGRGEKEGHVMIQTYQPEHYSIVHAKNHDYKGFYEEEILYRQLLKYPPIEQLLAVQIFAKDAKVGRELAQYLANNCLKFGNTVQVLGPKEGVIEKVQDTYRFVFYIKSKQYEQLVQIKDFLEEKINTLNLKRESIHFDFNPINLF